MPTIDHSVLTGTEIHEPKGADTATVNQVYVADGAGTGSWKTAWNSWWWNYDHSVTTPVALTSGVKTDIDNDTAGPASLDFNKLPTATGIWDASTNSFDWAAGGLSLGDECFMRIDIDFITSSNNDGFLLEIDLAHGHAGEINLPILEVNLDTAGTHEIIALFRVFLGNSDIASEPAKLSITADSGADSYVLNGFYISAEPTNPVYV